MMPRPKQPSKLPPLKDIQRLHFKLSDEQRKGFADNLKIPSLDADVAGVIEEILSSHKTARTLLKNQESGTTPANVSLLLANLVEHLGPFLDPVYGLDSQTFDDLMPLASALHNAAHKRMEELQHHPKLASTNAELKRVTIPNLRRVWERYANTAATEDRSKLREFIAYALGCIHERCPDPTEHPGKFDEFINAELPPP